MRIRNCTDQRLLAVLSVDGVNAVTGETASPDQSGYVIEPGGYVTVQGWRKDLDRTAAFYFSDPEDSYAARTGRPNDLGVIGVALFRERPIERQDWLSRGTSSRLRRRRRKRRRPPTRPGKRRTATPKARGRGAGAAHAATIAGHGSWTRGVLAGRTGRIRARQHARRTNWSRSVTNVARRSSRWVSCRGRDMACAIPIRSRAR